MGVGASGTDTGRWAEFHCLTCYLSVKQNVLDSSVLKKVLHCVFMMLDCSSKPDF